MNPGTDKITEKNLEQVIKTLLRPRDPGGSKGVFGTVSMIVGSSLYRGCASLAAEAALRSGCGIVRICSTEKVISAAANRLPEAIFLPLTEKDGHTDPDSVDMGQIASRSDAVLCGCGLTDCPDTLDTVGKLTETSLPLVLDADALNVISHSPDFSFPPRAVITPHIGEMARLAGASVGEILADQENAAVSYARKHSITVVLKGARTVVSDGVDTSVLDIPNSALAKGGSGDVLAGMIVSLLAQGYGLYTAALLGVCLHSRAGLRAAARLGEASALPSDVIREI